MGSLKISGIVKWWGLKYLGPLYSITWYYHDYVDRHVHV